jgi:hypothetical protein
VRRPWQAGLAALALLGTLAGCSTLGGGHDHPPPPDDRAVAEADALREEVLALAAFLQATPAAEAELIEAARVASETVPSAGNRLRYALLLAVPGTAAGDAVAARRQLSELLARPEWHSPAERALATVLLANVEERLLLAEDARQAGEGEAQRGHEKQAQLQKRLQAEADESARLRRALEDAQRKLEALTELERSITASPTNPQP